LLLNILQNDFNGDIQLCSVMNRAFNGLVYVYLVMEVSKDLHFIYLFFHFSCNYSLKMLWYYRKRNNYCYTKSTHYIANSSV